METKKRKSPEEMYSLIEAYLKSGLSQQKYRQQAQLGKSSFEHWLKKYRHEKGVSIPVKNTKSFIAVKLTGSPRQTEEENQQIKILYPNGVQVQCWLSIGITQIKELIKQ